MAEGHSGKLLNKTLPCDLGILMRTIAHCSRVGQKMSHLLSTRNHSTYLRLICNRVPSKSPVQCPV